MRKRVLTLLGVVSAGLCFGQSLLVQTTTNGTLSKPTTFFTANQAAINAIITNTPNGVTAAVTNQWQIDATNAALTFATNVSGITSSDAANIVNTSAVAGVSTRLPMNTLKKLKAGSLTKMLWVGDSLVGYGIYKTIPWGSFRQDLQANFGTNGYYGQGVTVPAAWSTAPITGIGWATHLIDDDPIWIVNLYRLTNGYAQLLYPNWGTGSGVGNAWLSADNLSWVYVKTNSKWTGTLTISTTTEAGVTNVLDVIDCNGTEGLVATNYTFTPGSYRFWIEASGAAPVLYGTPGAWNSTEGGIRWGALATDGLNNFPSWWGDVIATNFTPDVLFFIDDNDSAGLAQSTAFLRQVQVHSPNTDIVIVQQPPTVEEQLRNGVMERFALTNANTSFFDQYRLLGGWQSHYSLTNVGIFSADGVHPSTTDTTLQDALGGMLYKQLGFDTIPATIAGAVGVSLAGDNDWLGTNSFNTFGVRGQWGYFYGDGIAVNGPSTNLQILIKSRDTTGDPTDVYRYYVDNHSFRWGAAGDGGAYRFGINIGDEGVGKLSVAPSSDYDWAQYGMMMGTTTSPWWFVGQNLTLVTNKWDPPATAPAPGAAFIWNKDGTNYIMESSANSTAWDRTNVLGQAGGTGAQTGVVNTWTAAQIFDGGAVFTNGTTTFGATTADSLSIGGGITQTNPLSTNTLAGHLSLSTVSGSGSGLTSLGAANVTGTLSAAVTSNSIYGTPGLKSRLLQYSTADARPIHTELKTYAYPSSPLGSAVDYHTFETIVEAESANLNSYAGLYPLESTVTLATGTVGNGVGGYFHVQAVAPSTMLNSKNIRIWTQCSGGGFISNQFGIYWDTMSGGAYANTYGLYLPNQTVGTNQNWGIYSLADSNYFANIQAAGLTLSGAAYSTASTATNGGADNEFVTWGGMRAQFAGQGVTYYNTPYPAVAWTNSDYAYGTNFSYNTVAPAYGARTYVGLTNGQYFASSTTTNRFLDIEAGMTVLRYISVANGSGTAGPAIKSESYISYDGTNWTIAAVGAGDWDGSTQYIPEGGTNLYDSIIANPRYTSTNATGVFVQTRMKMVTQTTPTASDVTVHYGTNYASHVTLSGASSTSGNVYAAANNVFTGSNTVSHVYSTGAQYAKTLSTQTNYTFSASDTVVFVTGTNTVITLPNCTNTTAGRIVQVIVDNTYGSAIVTNANGVQLLNGALKQTLGATGTTTNSFTSVNTGSNWP